MLSLPAEILLEIGKIDKVTYRSMLAVPKFARAVTIGYRLDIMEANGYDYSGLFRGSCGFNVVRTRGPHTMKLYVSSKVRLNEVKYYPLFGIIDSAIGASYSINSHLACWYCGSKNYNFGYRSIYGTHTRYISQYGAYDIAACT